MVDGAHRDTGFGHDGEDETDLIAPARFRAGRVFLLGDAAHLTPPFIGQGLGAGLRDADNLAWKLAHVLTGQAGEDLLTSYDTERRPHAGAMVKKRS